MFIGDQRILTRNKRPACAAIFITIDKRVVRYDLSALKVKLKSHLTGAHRHKSFAHILLVLLLAKQEKESPSSRSSYFASQGAISKRRFIHLVDMVIGDSRRKPLLDLPTFVKQKAKL